MLLAGVASITAVSLTKPAFSQAGSQLSMSDSPLPNALDIFYQNLIELCQANGFNDNTDRLVLNNTITSFDIAEDTPYFNEGLFRRFADRVYTKGSDELAPASQADRFSFIYDRLLKTVAVQIDQRHPEIAGKLQELRGVLDRETTKLTDKITDLEAQWDRLARSRGLKADTPNYDLQQIKFFEQIKYVDQINVYSNRITDMVIRIEQVRRAAYTPAETLFLNTVAEMTDSKKISRPLRPSFERTTVESRNDLFWADPKRNPESLCDISLPLYPLGDLQNFLKAQGTRQPFSVTKTSTVTRHHDEAWGASAGGSISFFGIGIGGSGSGGGGSGFTNTVSTADGLMIGFENIDEVLIDRGYWFNPPLFDNADLAKLLYAQPDVNRLRFAAASLIICRGLSLSLTSSTDIDDNTWSHQNIAASGGVSFMGFRFGGSGAKQVNDYTVSVSGDKRTVTFKDDSKLCRLLGVRLVDFAKSQPIREMGTKAVNPKMSHSRYISDEALLRLKAKQATYRDSFSR
jgi:uncharacterized membrane protein YgcG